MRAMSIAKRGGPEVFEEIETAAPSAKPGHLVVKVAATSINPVDTKCRALDLPFAPKLPAILHGDVAGTVTGIGDGVTGFSVGDAVYGCAGAFGGYAGALAEYMLVDADLMAPAPKGLSMAEAAALPLVVLTAWEGLYDKSNVGPGDTVLVYGATGGVGHVAVQLAKARGARVSATSSAAKMDAAKTMGADELIDHHAEAVADYTKRLTGGAGFDIVFDTVGGPHLQTAFDATRRNGQVISIVRSEADYTQINAKAMSVHGVLMLLPMLTGVGRAHHGHILREAAKMAEAGTLKPLVDKKSFSIWDAAAAHAHFETGTAVGKVVLTA